jgi:hypothetical protein
VSRRPTLLGARWPSCRRSLSASASIGCTGSAARSAQPSPRQILVPAACSGPGADA